MPSFRSAICRDSRASPIQRQKRIPLLNDFSDVIISAIHEHGGDVLKLIGDEPLRFLRLKTACMRVTRHYPRQSRHARRCRIE